MNSKKIIALLLAVLMSLTMFGCSNTDDGGSDEKVSVTVTVWGPQEDQSADNGNWLQTQCDAFAAAHPEWDLTFVYGVCSEGDAKTNVGTDPTAAADVYFYANDQIPDLVATNSLAKLGGENLNSIKALNSETSMNTVTYEGSVYGFPFTSNTWFMYYDSSVFTAEDITSLEAMLAKGKVAFPLENSWYIASFYVANGCTLFGADGTDAAAGIDFSGDKAVEVTNYLVDLIANPNFASGDVSTVSDASAFFSGSWDYQKALDAYGSNLAAAAIPTITINGEAKQMKAFAGTKAVGVNPSTSLYAEHPEIAVALAAFLANEESQAKHYELRNIVPTIASVDVGTDIVAKAQVDIMTYASIVQPLQANMGLYWSPAESMGKEIVAGTVTHDNAAAKTEDMNTAMNTSVVQ